MHLHLPLHLVSRRNLAAVLRRVSVLQEHMSLDHQAAFQELYRNVWADHADMVSIQYTGTGALKTDFTRWTGGLVVVKWCSALVSTG